jgi:hypothetical protein
MVGCVTESGIAYGITGTDQREFMNTFENNNKVNKKPERKRKNLIRLGVEQEMAYQWSRSRMGGWAIAQSPILGTTITLERLGKRGYESLLTYYEKVAPHLNEPLYTRPVRTVV